MNTPIISVQGLSKRYKFRRGGVAGFRDELVRMVRGAKTEPLATASTDFWALENVSFEIYPGEIVGVMGGHGAGKSTLLKILSNLVRPTNGDLAVNGRVANLIEVGAGFNPQLTGRENLKLNGAKVGTSREHIATQCDAIVEFSGVGSLIDAPLEQFPSDMAVRLGFAFVAHSTAEILLVDEVLDLTDPDFQRRALRRLYEVSHQQGKTILFVSRSIDSIRRLCRRCIVLEGGKLLGIFPVEEAIDRCAPPTPPSDFDLDVSARERDWGTTASVARIVRVRVLSSDALRFDGPFTIELTLDVNELIPAATVAFAMNSPSGQRVLTLESDREGEPLTLKPGRAIVRMSLEHLPVSAGRYSCDASIRGAVCYDLIEGFAEWDVLRRIDGKINDRSFKGCSVRPTVEFLGAES